MMMYSDIRTPTHSLVVAWWSSSSSMDRNDQQLALGNWDEMVLYCVRRNNGVRCSSSNSSATYLIGIRQRKKICRRRRRWMEGNPWKASKQRTIHTLTWVREGLSCQYKTSFRPNFPLELLQTLSGLVVVLLVLCCLKSFFSWYIHLYILLFSSFRA